MDYQTKETALIAASWIDIPENFTGVVKYFDDYRWYVNGVMHRECGPAGEYSDGSKHWYSNGKLHRENGSAIERYDGRKYWYLNGKWYPQEEWFEALTPEQKEKFIWNF